MFNSPPDAFSFAAGTAILLLTLADMMRTVLAAGAGGGMVSARVAEWQWQTVLAIHRRRQSHGMLRGAGLVIFGSVVVVWLVALWLGWWLIFMALDSIESSSTRESAGFWETGYYAGFVLFTLGTGDFVPNGNLSRILTVVATMSGLGLVTMAVAYLMPVVSAASNRRSFARLVDIAGATPAGLVANAHVDGEPAGLLASAEQLAEQVVRIGEQHLAYPVLHYYHSDSLNTAFPVRLAALDEAVTLLSEAMPNVEGSAVARLGPLRASIGHLLDDLRVPGARVEEVAPPPVDLADLIEGGITFDEAAYRTALDRRRRHRMRMAWLIEHDGWNWRDVVLATRSTALCPASGSTPERASPGVADTWKERRP